VISGCFVSLTNIVSWVAENKGFSATALAALPIIWGILQPILAARTARKQKRFENYHALIKQLVERDDPDVPMRLDRQLAVVFELGLYREYKVPTLKILIGLKEDWTEGHEGPATKVKRLTRQMDETIAKLSKLYW
jgi:hypothetical protein